MADSIIQAGDCMVVYSIATGRIRRWFVSDRDDEIKRVDLAQGEALLQVPKLKDMNLDTLQEKVFEAIGKRPASDRYVVVDKAGAIHGAILADPSCGDALPGFELIQHDTADARWRFDGAFIPPVLTKEDIENALKAALR